MHFPWLPTMAAGSVAKITLLLRGSSAASPGAVCIRTAIGCAYMPGSAQNLTYGANTDTVVSPVPDAGSGGSVAAEVPVLFPASQAIGTLCAVRIMRMGGGVGGCADTLDGDLEVRPASMRDVP